jgi:YYY domain-containing protein
MGEMFSWWLLVELLALAGLPLASIFFTNLPDRGWALGKALSLMITGWLLWFPLAVVPALPYARLWILAIFILFAAGNVALAWRLRLWLGLREFIARRWGYVLASEAVFTLSFALMGWIRSYTPAVVDTEKFMDAAFLSSLWRAPHLPAPDPWLSGEPINYYYFGHFLIATFAKLLGTQPGTAFNVGIALIFALAAVTIFGVAVNLTAVLRPSAAALRRAIPFGLASALLVLVLGNLNGAQVWWQDANDLARGPASPLPNPWAWWTHRDLWTSYHWWNPSRVIDGTINEFPAFSFTLADLHAHVLALPFAALAVGIALNLLLARGDGVRAFGRGLAGILSLGVAAVALGGLYVINGWDLPTYLGLALVALGIQQWLEHGRRLSLLFCIDLASAAMMLAALSFLLYLPFYRGFVSPSSGIALVPPAQRSPIGDEVAIFGLPLFIILSLLLLWLARLAGAAFQYHPPLLGESSSSVAVRAQREHVWGGVAGASVVVVSFALLFLWTLATRGNSGWTLLWCLLLLLVCALLALRRIMPSTRDGAASDATDAADVAMRGEVLLLVLVGTAAALVAACELIYLRDIFNSRMNTVFKLYFQAWLLLGIAGGPALALLLRSARGWLRALQTEVAAISPSAPGQAALPADGALALAGTSGGHAAQLPGALARWRMLRSATPTSADTSAASAAADERSTSERQRVVAHPASIQNIPIVLRWVGAGGILIWMALLLLLVAAALVYPVLATSAHTSNFSPERTLDGTAYMASDPPGQPAGCNNTYGAGSNHDDNEGIAWLNAHVEGNPVIVEAPGCEWSHYSRISSFTGLPTLIGWPGGHEGEWRANWLPRYTQGDIFAQRTDAVNRIYTSSDPAVVRNLLTAYHVRYVYVGAAERDLYPSMDFSKFNSFLRAVYDRDGVTIYEVRVGG